MRKAVKVLLIILISVMTLSAVLFATYYFITSDARLDPGKLIDYGNAITVYDDSGEKIESASSHTKRKSVLLSELNGDTVNAFVASEDRRFYKHSGIDYKRMAKALYKNVLSLSFKEGASTISQQLIKNTHLSNDKTLARKLKEIRLARQLEKKYTKDEILEMYLNTIYFGHNCYGLQSAANFYFDKNAAELTLDESATIVGLLSSPNNYSPFNNPEKCLEKRNVVLNAMENCGYISRERNEKTKALPLSARKNAQTEKNSDYYAAMFEELTSLELDPYCDMQNCKIYTYMQQDLQETIEKIEADSDCSIFIRGAKGKIHAYKSTIGNSRRQPASAIKPILVYAPALEQKKLHTFTKIKDEAVNFNGYTPENFDKKYHGYVTVSDSIINSYNVPAVKTLNMLGIDNAIEFADKMNLKINDGDKNLALALGGMEQGFTLKEICDAYSTFQNGGNFKSSHFIKRIENAEGKIIYEDNSEIKKVFSESTCSLVNATLIETAKKGTARKLKNFQYDIACKTGTGGNSQGNTDAYAISYTSDYLVGVWLGNADYSKIDATGGGDCCEILKEIYPEIYKLTKPENLDVKSGTQEIYLDRDEYEKNNKIIIADPVSPAKKRLRVLCAKENLPLEFCSRFSRPEIKKPQIFVNNSTVSMHLCQTEYYYYLIKRGETVIFDNIWQEEISDSPPDGTYVYTVTPYYFDGKNKYFGDELVLPQILIESGLSQNPPDIIFKDWFND